jgi:hypothetical protein
MGPRASDDGVRQDQASGAQAELRRVGERIVATRSHDWGVRLSDRIRQAIAIGDLAGARTLAQHGDGLARSLASEYTLMVKGLGITIRVLLDLLPETLERSARRHDAPTGSRSIDDAAARLAGILRDFRAALAPDAETKTPAASEPVFAPRRTAIATVSGELDPTSRALADAERAFLEQQTRLAADVERALEANDGERARALVDRKEAHGYLPLHDRLVRFMADVFGWVLEAGGPVELLKLHSDTAEGQRRGFEKWDAMSAEEFARATAFLLRQHMGNVAVREDDEKLTIEQTPCGSGGRLRLAGVYAGPDALPMVQSPGPLTLGQPRFPVYCSHCPIWNGLAPIQWFGRPHWVFDNPSRADGSCTLHIYKRRDGAPDDYWRRLGLSRGDPRGDQ